MNGEELAKASPGPKEGHACRAKGQGGPSPVGEGEALRIRQAHTSAGDPLNPQHRVPPEEKVPPHRSRRGAMQGGKD